MMGNGDRRIAAATIGSCTIIVALSASVAAYFTPPHDKLTEGSINTLISKHEDVPDLAKFRANMVSGSGGFWNGVERGAHGGPNVGLIVGTYRWLANNGGRFEDWVMEVEKAYKAGKFSQAYSQIGILAHLVQDQTVPAHSANISHKTDHFEAYTKPSPPIHLLEGPLPVEPSAYDYYVRTIRLTQEVLPTYIDHDNNVQYWVQVGAYDGQPCSPVPPGGTCVLGHYGRKVYYRDPRTGVRTETWEDTFAPSKPQSGDIIPHQIDLAVGYTAGMLVAISKKLPPLIQGAALTPTTWNGSGTMVLAFHALENRRPAVTLKAVVLDESGETELGEAAIPDPNITLGAGTALPYEGDVIRSWDGKYLGGAGQRCGGPSGSCHLTTSNSSNILDASGAWSANPIILGPGTVVGSTSSAVAFDLNGILVVARVEAVLSELAPGASYMAPSGSLFYLMRIGRPTPAANQANLTVGGVSSSPGPIPFPSPAAYRSSIRETRR